MTPLVGFDVRPIPFKNCKVIGRDISYAVYSRQNAARGSREFSMSRGELLSFSACPEKWLAGVEDKSTKSTEFGTLVDGLMLMGMERFAESFAICPEFYEGKKGEMKPWTARADYCAEWEEAAEKAGKIVVRHRDHAEAIAAIKQFQGDHLKPAAKRAIAFVGASTKQVMVIGEYQDAETEIVVPVRCLIDMVPDLKTHFEKSIGDFKTAVSASLHPWTKAVFEHGYHVQAAINLDLYTAATGEDRCDFRHVIMENAPPYQVATRIVSTEYVNLGRHVVVAALKRYCQCLATGVWPDYDDSALQKIGGWAVTEPLEWMVNQSFQ